MKPFIVSVAAVASACVLAACTEKASTTDPNAMTQPNPLLAEWTGPYGGVPDFDKMDVALIEDAMDQGIARHLEELDAIGANTDDPSFENTILAMERSGKAIDRVWTYWGILSSNMSTPEFRAIQESMAPRLADYRSKILQNQALFDRIRAVYQGDDYQTLDTQQQRLVWLIYDSFASEGATLEGEAREKYAAINSRLAELYTRFANNVLADEEGYVTWLTSEDLDGLPESEKNAAAAAAAERGEQGRWAIINTRSSMDPFLTYSSNRGLREQVWRKYYNRSNNGDEYDNNEVIKEILKLRDQRVALLGYDNYAEWRLQNRMAKTPERAMALMENVWPAAVARVAEEVRDMQALADSEGAGIRIEPWDYRYYAEKVRRAKYELNSDEVKQYLQLDKLREAMFFVAGEIFGFDFVAVPEGTVPVFHPDVRVWEVTARSTGEHVGLWYLDPYARTGKRSGAWATSYRSHESFDGKKTVLSANNSNFTESAEGEPALISWDDAETLFHEFGHALHSLSSNVAYPTLNSGVRDFTELQSQVLERWLATDEVIDRFLVHYETGKPMPAELIAKIKAAANFNEGFRTTEYLASALVDMKYHTTDPEGIEPQVFEAETLAALGMPRELPMRHRSTQFGHIFSGEGYAAAYYGYMWADVLAADTAEAYLEAPGGLFDKEVASKMVSKLFAVRNAVDPADAYRDFRGRDAQVEALMRDLGFPVTTSAK
jgi:peptidyl-dipeptidase Dcp